MVKNGNINEWSILDFELYLREIKLINRQDKIVRAEVAGLGNMNYTHRAVTPTKSIILKQAPPYCAKFPSIPAPTERLRSENNFYQEAGKNSKLLQYFPQIYHFDENQNILCMEDLGLANDFEFMYRGEPQSTNPQQLHVYKNLMNFLSLLHQQKMSPARFENSSMRQLNYDYIFNLPFAENANFDADAVTLGLNSEIQIIKSNVLLQEQINKLGNLYLKSGDCLCHGDFFPKSWLLNESGEVKVIDAEFAIQSVKEFDLAVLKAHLIMSHMSESQISSILNDYTNPYDEKLVNAFAGVEILRRLFFVAQLPLTADLSTKKKWISLAKSWILN